MINPVFSFEIIKYLDLCDYLKIEFDSIFRRPIQIRETEYRIFSIL